MSLLFTELAGTKSVNDCGLGDARIVGSGWGSYGCRAISASSSFAEVANPNFRLNSAYTVEWRWAVATLRNYNAGVTRTNGAIGSPMDNYLQSTGTFTFGDALGAGSLINISSFAVAQEWHAVVICGSPGAPTEVFKQGQKVASGGSGNISDGGFPVRIGSRNDGATNADAQFERARIWSRRLSDSEAEWLYVEPYAMFRPLVRRCYFVSSAVLSGLLLRRRRMALAA